MKVKHFVAVHGEMCSLDYKINDFIRGKKVIDIKYSNSSYTEQDAVSTLNYGVKVCSALVMYEED